MVQRCREGVLRCSGSRSLFQWVLTPMLDVLLREALSQGADSGMHIMGMTKDGGHCCQRSHVHNKAIDRSGAQECNCAQQNEQSRHKINWCKSGNCIRQLIQVGRKRARKCLSINKAYQTIRLTFLLHHLQRVFATSSATT